MNEPENFLSRWSRRKREGDVAPDAEPPAKPAVDSPAEAVAAPAAEEPVFDPASLPSLDEIDAGTDVSLFMKPGVPAALRHAALRRAWTSDPAIRDFRGLQENDWDFTAPDSVPGFGSFISEDEIKALAQRLFGDTTPALGPDSLANAQDSAVEPPKAAAPDERMLDENQDEQPTAGEQAEHKSTAPAPQQDDDAAPQRVAVRRHGGALPQ